jgi:hypothetical protein
MAETATPGVGPGEGSGGVTRTAATLITPTIVYVMVRAAESFNPSVSE